MNKPEIKRGVDPLCVLVLLFAIAGCFVSDGGGDGSDRSDKKKPGGGGIEAVAFEAFQARDRIAADLLDKVADDIDAGNLKYDKPIMDAIAEASDEANTQSAKPLQDALAKELNPGGTLNTKQAAKAIRAMAAGRRKAGK